jgi:hypothetical protein
MDEEMTETAAATGDSQKGKILLDYLNCNLSLYLSDQCGRCPIIKPTTAVTN